MSESIEDLKKELALYKQNGAVGLYYELNKFLNKTVEIMRNRNLENLITADEEDPKKFEKMMALIKMAKENLSDMIEIRSKLGLTGDEKIDKELKPFVETIAESRR